MPLFMLLLITLQGGDSVFRCEPMNMPFILSRMKETLSNDKYTKLSKIYTESLARHNEIKSLGGPNVEQVLALESSVGRQVELALNETELYLFRAFLEPRKGIFSLPKGHHAKFLELKAGQKSTIDKLCNSIEDKLTKLITSIVNDGSYMSYVPNKRDSFCTELAEDATRQLSSLFTETQSKRFLLLYDKAEFRATFIRKFMEVLSEVDSKRIEMKLRRENPVNLYNSAVNCILPIMDQDIFHQELECDAPQRAQLREIFTAFSRDMDDLTKLYRASLESEKHDDYVFFKTSSLDLTVRYQDRAESVLSAKQRERAGQLIAQIRGPSYAFGGKWKGKMGITFEQDSKAINVFTEGSKQFNPLTATKDHPDYRYIKNKFIGEYMADKLLSPEQRAKWLASLGKVLTDKEIKALAKVYYDRTKLVQKK